MILPIAPEACKKDHWCGRLTGLVKLKLLPESKDLAQFIRASERGISE
jgi:hypothetical protein